MKSNTLLNLIFAIFSITVFLSCNVYAQNQATDKKYTRITEANENLMAFMKKMNTDQNYFLDYIQFKETVCSQNISNLEKKKLLSFGNKLSEKTVKYFSNEIRTTASNKSGSNYIYDVYDTADLPKNLLDNAGKNLLQFSSATDEIISNYENCSSIYNSKLYENEYIAVVNSITKLHRSAVIKLVKR